MILAWASPFNLFQNTLDGQPLLNLPDVCTNAPVAGKAFCSFHCEFCEKQPKSVPTGLRQFLRYAGNYYFFGWQPKDNYMHIE